ncbi:unnamed protein product [Toxocara canis]|uniref:DUF5597 domain-containing protein n=1 Tax=Toxocara canis TaxID=6265 RepID=A0A183U907_TOXCA|nr:unnamed protein product [Toxocara canis]
MKGGSVLRPVFFEFPDDKNTHDLGYQFMWGSAVMVVPAVYPGQNTVSGYLPTGAIWYSLRETEYGQLVQGGHQEFSARIDELPPVFLKGGTIISRQRPNTTTTASRMNPFEIIIALGE